MKFLHIISKNLLFFATCFLLIFIPLYPKLPIIGVTHTWVYVRAEDFIIASILTIWIFLILFKKVKLKTPLTIPIFLFWVIGALSTIHGVLILFPTLPNVFPNVAFLNFLRRIEYLSLFFIAYSSIRDKKLINYVIGVLTVTLLLIVFYGFGQKFFGFPAFLTGNEEFAKGIPLRISQLGRVPSTFAGHYDLAAYLVLMVPIFVSLIFGVRSLLLKSLFFITSSLSFILLFMTVSRISFFVLIFSLAVLLISQKKKFFIASLIVLILALLILSPTLLKRFNSTLTDVNVLVNARTGDAISEVKELPREYFKNKVVLKDNSTLKDAKASSSAVLPYLEIPETVEFIVQANASTGENLPQGTGYVNLQLSPILKRSDIYFTEIKDPSGIKTPEIHAFLGNFLVKRARAYDLSFTTRFQGEWPRTFDSFKRNIFLGSGYGSVSLAVDNNYLRILGESGLFGFAAFALLFLSAGVYIKKTYSSVDSPLVRSFVLGVAAGTLGLLLNATLIDVFEASKIAFSFWLLLGITLGTLHLYSKDIKINLYEEVKKVLFSPYAIIFYLLVGTVAIFMPLYTNYFVGDDFTWLKWVADLKSNLFTYFTNSDGFFYRPGARLYFLLMYKLFWLNQTFYHMVSIALYFSVSVLVFIILNKILNKYVLSVIAAFLFLILSGHQEAVFWISSTGFLFTSVFTLLSLLSFVFWKEKGKQVYLIATLVFIVLSVLFHEVGIVSPLIIIAYDFVFRENLKLVFRKYYLLILSPLLPYLLLRVISQSHWFSGDYNYNLIKLPFNVVGNTIGYFVLNFFGPQSLSFYESLRNVLRTNFVFATFGSLTILFLLYLIFRLANRKLNLDEKKTVVFGLLFFFISLIPFLGLGNITSRYSYLSSIGFVIIFAFFVNRLFFYLKTLSDKYTFSMLTILVSIIFLSLQLFQLQSIHTDWKTAGERVKNFLTSFEDVFLLTQYGNYSEYDKKTQLNFYFVNVPIRYGEAWVLPVGIKDALWFALNNKNFAVETFSNLNDALYKAEITPNSHVFLFEKEGTVRKVFKIKNSIMILPQK